MARVGVIEQMRLHSQTSQYGALSRGLRMLPDESKERLRAALREIRSGSFAAEWGSEQAGGYQRFAALREAARAHDINRAEVLGRELLERSRLRSDE
jgi:ketol-acid reductoisomerase